MNPLGKIEKIDDLRSIWPHEALDFSKWLAQEENLSSLGDAIGIDLVLGELESPAGGFSVDIYASEEGTGRKVIIENQLEDTNHDHLGKIITYASWKRAEVIIWIVKRARDEHKQAIEWLNQHTDQNIGFFLLEIELWKIGNSLPAPMFRVIECPNDWTKNMKAIVGLSDTKKLQMEFWQAFSDYAFASATPFSKAFNKRKAQPQHWYSLSLGNSVYHLSFTVNTQKKLLGTEVYIQNDKELFEKIKTRKEEIENELGIHLEWIEAKQDCRILAVHSGDIKKSTDKWPEFFDWFCEMGLKFKSVAEKYF